MPCSRGPRWRRLRRRWFGTGAVIVSHRHRFVFLAVPRTASHAVRAALAPLLGPEDWQQEALRLRLRSPLPGLAAIRHGHASARQASAELPATLWRDYFKFAFVRDPFDRFVSICAMLNKRNPGYVGRERAFMKQALARSRFRSRVLVRPQTAMLVDADGGIALDCLGRYECLDASFRGICKRLGIPPRVLGRHNASIAGTPAAAIYDAELQAMVGSFYRRDFELLGYADRLCA